ncbi:unnamed protein product [Phytophthora fragariaefolia]|uniref:Unnamed protein product n=1 Tax=Phytophthora fragariaefolia TaxID=1490495 RepID=A0A9W6XYD9_9STRA|nr:unnamed protein product [Phytophthora fragariaefolia]
MDLDDTSAMVAILVGDSEGRRSTHSSTASALLWSRISKLDELQKLLDKLQKINEALMELHEAIAVRVADDMHEALKTATSGSEPRQNVNASFPTCSVLLSASVMYKTDKLMTLRLLWRRYSCSFRMSTPTTQAAGTPAASAAENTVVANSATTGSSPAFTSVVTSTVTTPSSPKRTMSLGEYKVTRGNALFARDELEALFDVGSDADMEDGEEEDEGISSSRRDDPSVGSRRPREDDSDASSSKRSRSGSDRPLADAGPLSSPRSGGDSTSSDTVVSRTGPVRDPWMPTPSEIHTRFGSTPPPSHSDDTRIRRLPVEAECPNGRHSVKAGVHLLKTSTKTPLATVSVFA